ncbi:TolC family protein [Bacteroidales bacterium OttesenSCG-928-M11]|nr:TolC family protein [Bacteroidales bacterium OttesenSCG-928-M11]
MTRRLIVIVSLLSIYALTAQAQKKWNLEECINHATEHNISIKQQELRRETAEISLNTSRMSRLPDLNASLGNTWNRSSNTDSLISNKHIISSSASFSISTSVPVFTGFRIKNEIERDKIALEAATLNLERAKEDLSLSVTYLFLEVLFNKEIVEISKEQLEISQTQIARTKALVDAEKVPKSQYYDIEAQVAQDEVSLVNAEKNLELSLLDLAQSLELEHETDFDILVPTFDHPIIEHMASLQKPDIVFANALSVKPGIKMIELEVEGAEKSHNIAKSAYYPSLSLNAGYGTGYSYIYDLPWPNESFSSQIKDGREYIGLSLSIPIFNRFSTRNNVKTSKINILNQKLALEDAKKTLYKEIQTAHLNATSALKAYLASNKAVKASSESFKYTQERYEVGKSTVFEFNDAKLALTRSQSEMVKAKYDYIFRTKILDFYNGIPIRL